MGYARRLQGGAAPASTSAPTGGLRDHSGASTLAAEPGTSQVAATTVYSLASAKRQFTCRQKMMTATLWVGGGG